MTFLIALGWVVGAVALMTLVIWLVCPPPLEPPEVSASSTQEDKAVGAVLVLFVDGGHEVQTYGVLPERELALAEAGEALRRAGR